MAPYSISPGRCGYRYGASSGSPCERLPTPPQRQRTPAMRVSVCVISYRRPEELARLLAGMNQLTFERTPAPDLEILVVDNDPEQSAAAVCSAARAQLKWPLRYELEPRRGIPYARNTAVRSVIDRADFVAFLDDDEVPDPRWLDELLYVQDLQDADVVAGPVLPHFVGLAPTWVKRGGFFDRTRHSTGSRLTVARTGNVLVRIRVFHQMDPLFDERLALTGGSDTHFFLRVSQTGYKLVWADEAIVREWLPESRLTARYVLQRGFRIGNTRGICERDLGGSRGPRTVGSLRAVWWIAKGVGLLPVSLFRGAHAIIKSVWSVCMGAGYFAGRVGLHFEEYRTPDGG